MSVVRMLGAFGLAFIVSFAIEVVGQGLWGPMSLANLRFHPEIPWAAPLMAGVLVLLLLYLSGRGWPSSTSARRRELLRWNSIPPSKFVLALIAGWLAMAAFGGLWIVVSDVVRLTPGVQPKATGVPLASAIIFLLTSAVAAPVTEEAAFRGYAMGILKRAWGSTSAALIGSTVLFAAAHFLQGLDPVKLTLYFAAGLIFALVAELTNSLYAVMIVHGSADIMGFTVLWPHDQQAHAMGFSDPVFLPALAALAIFTPAAVIAFRRLAGPARRSPAGPAGSAVVGG